MTPREWKTRLSGKMGVTTAMLAALALSFIVYVRAEKLIDDAHDLRYLSYQLASELRQSSDDLTRMVRTYVVTGDPFYKQSYLDILDIRDGHKPRPENYQYVYWDLVVADSRNPRPETGQAIPLLDLMRQARFSAEELGKLAEAKANSDDLTATEFAAMTMIEADAPANRERASRMLHDDAYHQAKAAIMRPINQFLVLADKRTLAAVEDAEHAALVSRMAFIAVALSAIALLWRAQRELRSTLGGSADDVHRQITRIGRGDFSIPISVPPDAKDSVLAGLSDMQVRLNSLHLERQRTEDMLRYQNEALERSNAELEAFAYVASHDLREPLRNVTAFSTLLARKLAGRLGEDERDDLKIITDAANRMDSLVRDLLEVSRVGRNQQAMHPLGLREVVSDAVDSLRVQIEATGARIEHPADLPMVRGDKEELYRLVMNIIGNALKYHGADPPLIHIRCAPEGASFWRLEIADNGIGIENGHGYEDRIFGLFQRLHQRDEYGGGTGIGLPICRKIVERHGGRIWVESAGLGKGSTFIVTLPRLPETA